MNDQTRVAVLGAGGHGHVMVDVLRCQGNDQLVFLDDSDTLQGTQTRAGVQVVGYTERDSIANCGAEAFVAAIGNNAIRKTLFDRCLDAGLNPWQAIHPSATISESAELKDGVQIVAQAVVNPHTEIGQNVILNTGCTVDHDCVVGDHAFVAPGVNLGGEVQIGDMAMIGIGASILPGVEIGEGATVGAGAVVVKDIPSWCVAIGVPARVVQREPSPYVT